MSTPGRLARSKGSMKVDARRRTRRELVFEERMGAEERKKAVKKAVKTGSRFIEKGSSYIPMLHSMSTAWSVRLTLALAQQCAGALQARWT